MIPKVCKSHATNGEEERPTLQWPPPAETVEEQAKDQIPTAARSPTAFDEGRSDAGVQAPIKIVDVRPWSPRIYQALHQQGKSLGVAWERAFIQYSHF
jgi:hypothetical protein